jgi:hypothetical protein
MFVAVDRPVLDRDPSQPSDFAIAVTEAPHGPLRRLVADASASRDLVERTIAVAMRHNLVDYDPGASLLASGELRSHGRRHTSRRGKLPAALNRFFPVGRPLISATGEASAISLRPAIRPPDSRADRDLAHRITGHEIGVGRRFPSENRSNFRVAKGGDHRSPPS